MFLLLFLFLGGRRKPEILEKSYVYMVRRYTEPTDNNELEFRIQQPTLKLWNGDAIPCVTLQPQGWSDPQLNTTGYFWIFNSVSLFCHLNNT